MVDVTEAAMRSFGYRVTPPSDPDDCIAWEVHCPDRVTVLLAKDEADAWERADTHWRAKSISEALNFTRPAPDGEPIAWMRMNGGGTASTGVTDLVRYRDEWLAEGDKVVALYAHPPRNDAVVEALREALNPIGAADCPRCGRDTPHRHEPDETSKGFEPNLWSRLEKLADALDRPPHDFYAAAGSAFGGAIDDLNYSRYLARDLRKTVTRVRTALSALKQGEPR